jgi:hypothetical protein
LDARIYPKDALIGGGQPSDESNESRGVLVDIEGRGDFSACTVKMYETCVVLSEHERSNIESIGLVT